MFVRIEIDDAMGKHNVIPMILHVEIFIQNLAQSFYNTHCIMFGCIDKQYDELISSQSRKKIRVAAYSAHFIGKNGQCIVTFCMAEGIVDPFEFIQIQISQ